MSVVAPISACGAIVPVAAASPATSQAPSPASASSPPSPASSSSPAPPPPPGARVSRRAREVGSGAGDGAGFGARVRAVLCVRGRRNDRVPWRTAVGDRRGQDQLAGDVVNDRARRPRGRLGAALAGPPDRPGGAGRRRRHRGNLLFAYAVTAGNLAVVGVLGSLYPVATVVLARWLLGERLSGGQNAGVVLALTGVGLLAAALVGRAEVSCPRPVRSWSSSMRRDASALVRSSSNGSLAWSESVLR